MVRKCPKRHSPAVVIYTIENKGVLNNTKHYLIMDWNASMMVEVTLKSPDDFLKVRETLTRIGVASRSENKLYQSCHILHKQGKYYIVSFKELFLLDGKHSDFSENDAQRRNRITKLLSDWGLVDVVVPETIDEMCSMSQIKILPHKEKADWELIPKYSIGSKKDK